MNTGKTLFALHMDFLPWTTITRIVDRYERLGPEFEISSELIAARKRAKLTSRQRRATSMRSSTAIKSPSA